MSDILVEEYKRRSKLGITAPLNESEVIQAQSLSTVQSRPHGVNCLSDSESQQGCAVEKANQEVK
jgi:hypothetical protein